MKTRFLCGVAAFAGSLCAGATAHAASCDGLADIGLFGVEIATAQSQAAQVLPPDPMSGMTGGSPKPVEVGAHCLVEGQIDDREGVNGRYGIRFQMRMPEDWNGRFLFQGGGGSDGFIAPATGSVPSHGSTAVPALKRGYAVVSMDGGHDGLGPDFAYDQQARIDLGYAAIGKVTQTAKALIRQYYAQAPEESFFMGCSNGGREAMMAAERYPTEFDGIVAGNPGFRLSKAALASLWDVQHFMAIAPDGILSRALTQEDLDMVSGAILQQCDGLDGNEDGIVAAPSQCMFDIETMRGTLADEKIDTLKAVMNGPHDADGRPVYSDWPWDPGISSDGWRAWKLGTSETAEPDALDATLSIGSLKALFMTPPRENLPDPVNYGALAENVSSVGGYFDADETYLSTFVHDGGKMVIFQGLADPIFSANDIARWYDQATADTGGDFVRLFMVPGMAHCGGGPALEDFDPLTALESWTETGEAPTAMPASGPAFPGRQMPICAYPTEAHLTGDDPNALESYTCR